MTAVSKIRWCRRCALCAPSGACLDQSLKSGRCGDWVWYLLRGSKQCRRLWVKPKDPRTHKQRSCRARLRAASKAYSEFLTDAEQDACIAAGAKVRTRVRAGSSGTLTGHQYFVQGKIKRTKTLASIAKSHSRPSNMQQPQRNTRASSGTHRLPSGTAPGQHRRKVGTAGKAKGGGAKAEGRMKKEEVPSQDFQQQTFTRSTGARQRGAAGARPARIAGPSAKRNARPGDVWYTSSGTGSTITVRLRRPKAEIAAKAKPNVNTWINDLIEQALGPRNAHSNQRIDRSSSGRKLHHSAKLKPAER
jgi:hypothetical protein